MIGAIRAIEVGVGQTFIAQNRWWKTAPSMEEISACVPLQSASGDIFKGWFKQDLPANFCLASSSTLTDNEKRHCRPEGTSVFQSPEEFMAYLYLDLCRNFDRNAFVAEIENRKKESEARLKLAEARRQKRRQRLTLADFAQEKHFAKWSKMWPRRVVSMARTIFRDAALQLIELGEKPNKSKCRTILKRIVSKFNELERDEKCIETEEREEVVAKVQELAELVGLDNKDERLTGHRDW